MQPSENYYDFLERPAQCPHCGWQGTGAQLDLGEMFAQSAEYLCPRCGGHCLHQLFPTLRDTAADPRAAPADRARAQAQLERLEAFERDKLRDPGQLPDLSPPDGVLTWDQPWPLGPAGGPQSFIVVLAGRREIWRERAWFECHGRFAEVAEVLKRKYGASLRDLAPTERSLTCLYGDAARAPAEVAAVRAGLARDD